jgi:hypothetical protein
MKYIDNLTMKLGLWLIGDRETPREITQIATIRSLQNERDAAIKERDELHAMLDTALKHDLKTTYKTTTIDKVARKIAKARKPAKGKKK